MSVLLDRNYEDSILRDEYGHILIATVTEYGAKKNHMAKSWGRSVAAPRSAPLARDLPLVTGLSGSGIVLSDIVNYCHNCLEISVFTKLHEKLKYDGS
jgi:hypothetical protein